MLQEVKTDTKKLDDYKKETPNEIISEIENISDSLKQKKVVHVNATSKHGGGGVAEILHSIVPLMNDQKIKASWYTINPPDRFFEITNKIHNSLQGKEDILTKEEKDFYIAESKKFTEELDKINADLFVIHDPQPLLFASFSKSKTPAISRIHIDLSNPNPDTWNFLLPHFENYKKIILSTHEFVNGNLPKGKVEVFPPAIDHIVAKNSHLKTEYAKMILENLGINPSKPIISQVSRLDPFKDPIGVIKSFYLAKKTLPDIQLVLLAQNIASDNPYAQKIFEEVVRYTKGDPDIYLFYDPKEIEYDNDTLVNAVQTASDIIIQKSLKEGFGLTVAEAMWKKRPVIGGRVGGIKIQIRDGYNGYLVSTIEHCAFRIEQLMQSKKLRKEIGERAKKSVAKNFLITRLLKDHLKTYKEVLK